MALVRKLVSPEERGNCTVNAKLSPRAVTRKLSCTHQHDARQQAQIRRRGARHCGLIDAPNASRAASRSECMRAPRPSKAVKLSLPRMGSAGAQAAR